MSDHVLITGGAGFIGTRLARRFVDAGHTVTVLDALIPQVHGDDPDTTSPLLRSLDGVADVVDGTVTSTRRPARRALDGATIVVHLAAETGTGQSMYEIDRYVETNVGGTAKLLDLLANEPHAVRRIVDRLVAVDLRRGRVPHRRRARSSTRRTARTPTWRPATSTCTSPARARSTVVPTDENAKLHPSSVYGITKQMQESLIMTVAPTIGIEPVALRYQNVYGPGQSLKNPYTGILSIFSTLIRQGKEINIFEDGLESRDFVYIDDVVEATFLGATHARCRGRRRSTSAPASRPP